MTRQIPLALLACCSLPAPASTDIPLAVPYQDSSGYIFSANGIVTGFSTDGAYVQAESTGWLAHGHSGRGSTITYTYECVQWSWDLTGYLVGESVLAQTKCSALDSTSRFANAGGYTAWTQDYLYYPAVHRPMLTTP